MGLVMSNKVERRKRKVKGEWVEDGVSETVKKKRSTYYKKDDDG